MSGDDAVDAVDQDRVGPAELDDTGGDLGDLCIGVDAWIAIIRIQVLDLSVLDVECVQWVCPEMQNPPCMTTGRVGMGGGVSGNRAW